MLYKKCKINKYLRLTRIQIKASSGITSCSRCICDECGRYIFDDEKGLSLQCICSEMYPPDDDYNTLGYAIKNEKDKIIKLIEKL